jgi:hypothetical protein
MKLISDRVSALEKDNVLSFVILPTTEKRKLIVMLLWLIAWSVCGIIVFVNYFKLDNPEAKTFTIVYLSFWFYFEFKITRAFLWKKYGKEKIWLKNGKLFYQKEVSGKGKIKEYDLNLIEDIDVLELRPSSFADTINQSFWIKGGERIQFRHQGKVIVFGMQLTDKEAKSIVKEISTYVLKFR